MVTIPNKVSEPKTLTVVDKFILFDSGLLTNTLASLVAKREAIAAFRIIFGKVPGG
jgi:hypothetical protein